MNKPDLFLKVQERATKARELYATSARAYCNTLVYGPFGGGKTRLATTAPRPVWIDSFDPGGTKIVALQPLIESGDVIVDNTWETDSWKAPFAFKEWEREMMGRISDGFFEHIGTYFLDSSTRWTMSIMYEILKIGDVKKGSRTGKTPELQDYLTQQLTAVDWLGKLMALPCHCVVTGHIGIHTDAVSGRMETGLLMWGQLATQFPLVFDEKWIALKKSDEWVLQTSTEGIYAAETRMGEGILKQFEAPDLRGMLERCKKSYQDKPRISGE